MDDGPPEPLAFLVVDPRTPREHLVPIQDRLVIGRERLDSVDQRGRLVIEDESVSRTHLEIRLQVERDQAWVLDMSTNGTRVNGSRIERSVPVQIRPGDRLRVGGTELEFRSRQFTADHSHDPFETVKDIRTEQMLMAVGDVVSFSTISQYTDERTLLQGIDTLYSELRRLLARHRGTVSNYVGDAFFATWEVASVPDAAARAVSFALDAVDSVTGIGPLLPLRDPSGQPVRMGWGISLGPAAVSSVTGMLVTVLGDSTNVAFRLSGLAGRDGWPDVVVTAAVQAEASGGFAFTQGAEVEVKGRVGRETVHGARRLDARR